MQNLNIAGFLSRDAEQRQTRDGSTVTQWNVPVRQGYGDKERTNWYRVAIWGKRADFAAKARKGAHVFVTGPLTIGEYDGKLQLEINASDFDYYMPKQDVQSAVKEHFPQAETVGNGGPGNRFTDDDDQIPFARNDGDW